MTDANKLKFDHVLIATKDHIRPFKIFGSGATVREAMKRCRKNGFNIEEMRSDAKGYRATLDATRLSDITQLRLRHGACCTAFDLGEPGAKPAFATEEPSTWEKIPKHSVGQVILHIGLVVSTAITVVRLFKGIWFFSLQGK